LIKAAKDEIFSFSCLLAAVQFLALSSLLSSFVLSSAGSGLGQMFCYWTVPDPGALFAPGAGSGQSSAHRLAQDSTGNP